MRKSVQTVVLLKNLSTGILAPVLTLTLLAHGATLQNVSLLIGAYSFTVIAAEFPSGLFADLYGRKTAFVVSTLCCLAGYGLLLVSQSMASLLIAMGLYGLGRAFSSGSMDALAMDAASDDTALVKTAARLAMLESVGLSLGALAGGALSGIGDGYAGNLIACLSVTFSMLLVTLLTVRETPSTKPQLCGAPPEMAHQNTLEKSPSLGMLVRGSLRFAFKPGIVRLLFLFSMLTGFAMLGLETYWQPALKAFSPPAWLFGVTSFVGFGSVMVGSKLTECLVRCKQNAGFTIWLSLKTLLSLSLTLLLLARGTAAFIGVYMLTYLLLGGGGVAESILLNRDAPSGQRASILSLFSFTLQIGGLIASLVGYCLGGGDRYHMLWVLASVLLLGAVVFTMLPRTWRRLFHGKSR